MENFKGTKGEWHCLEYSGYFTLQLGEYYGDKDLLDCDVFPRKEVVANAKIIAASKDLFKALKDITDNIENWLETGEPANKEESKALYDRAKEALKKAT